MKRIYTEEFVSRRARGRRSRINTRRRAPADTQSPQAGRRTAVSAREKARRDRVGSGGRASGRTTKVKMTRVIALGVLAVLAFIFFISCILTLADANAGPTVAETVRTIKAPQGSKAAAPGVWANAAVMIDGESGRVLYDKNARVKLPMASTTKMMTALVARDLCGLKDEVQIPLDATQVGEEGINLVAGEKLTVEQLLNAMMIQSANDASWALAKHAGGGSVETFCALMNKKAAELGANSTRFTNPHGLDQPGHYSTAYDLALIGRAVMRDAVLAKIVSTPKYSIPTPGQPWDRVAVGHNEILTRYTGADGIKTGYTGKAGLCLAASAKRDGKALIAVVLNSSHRADDVSALFNYGFGNTARIVFATRDQKLARSRVSSFPRRSVAVKPASEMAALTFLGSGDVFKVITSVQRNAHSPVKTGQKLGSITVLLNDKKMEEGDAVSARACAGSNLLGATGAFFWYSLCWTGKIIAAPFRIF